ncbi:uncharacterized protein [Drosophila kikkawai]|uniref:Uncharacterized protein isoform X2 n=1 Tax=Drosophila kikkawai TaxID=30033 RepID=A0A6P4I5E5_DROKI|nr:uncharacterized protein LOC108075435 isoform X1 [Drosophila kikkawai]XP_017023374.1 uncharacterized protein LOC108075435 isoform X1 [Drosophila kikkawai]XP_017023375.1 uncharacterized protein LOC108075435 isoform X1 [Drosophila kikkawai]XP_017023376.1 uncharacterized protein LOC108075435 isoform X1 [Drosophila kikkawai]
MVIDGYRFVIGASHVHRTYLKCANFRHNCRARAILNRDTNRVRMRHEGHNQMRRKDESQREGNKLKTNSDAKCSPAFHCTSRLAQYVRSNRGTDLVYHEGNTYTPNEKLRQGQKSRDWKCSMYHKAKCRARLVTKLTHGGDIIHVTSNLHTHPTMYTTTQKSKKQPCLERNPLCVPIRPSKMQTKTLCHGK